MPNFDQWMRNAIEGELKVYLSSYSAQSILINYVNGLSVHIYSVPTGVFRKYSVVPPYIITRIPVTKIATPIMCLNFNAGVFVTCWPPSWAEMRRKLDVA